MSKSLKSSFLEIEKQNLELEEYSKTLEQKVLDRTEKLKETNNDLQKAYLQVLELNNEKNEFLGIAAHDLKNPLVAIKGFGEIIQTDSTLERSELEEFAKTIVESSERMFDIITSLLDINRIEEGRIEINYETNSANKLLESLVTQNSEAANNKGITLKYNKIIDDVLFNTDKTLFLQVMDNFISNGIKFSPFNKNIDINVIDKNDSVVFEVKDYGPGLSDDDKSKLFQKFSKLSARPTAGEHSTGLGLSISKKIAEMLGGDIEVISELGKGASFSLVIPK
jgi:signal transduction histidine kinase